MQIYFILLVTFS